MDLAWSNLSLPQGAILLTGEVSQFERTAQRCEASFIGAPGVDLANGHPDPGAEGKVARE